MKNEELNKIISSKVETIRKENGLTQASLAQILGLTRVSICNIELGNQKLSADKIYVLCCIFNVEPTYFFPEIKKIDFYGLRKVVKRVIPKKVKYETVFKKINTF